MNPGTVSNSSYLQLSFCYVEISNYLGCYLLIYFVCHRLHALFIVNFDSLIFIKINIFMFNFNSFNSYIYSDQ